MSKVVIFLVLPYRQVDVGVYKCIDGIVMGNIVGKIWNVKLMCCQNHKHKQKIYRYWFGGKHRDVT